MPRHFIAAQKYGNWKPWINCIDDNPPGDGGGGGSGGATIESLQAEIQSLKQTAENQAGVIQNLRGFERKYKLAAEAVGDMDPSRLQQLKNAEENLAAQQRQSEDAALKIRQDVIAEYDPKLKTANSEKEALQSQLDDANLTYDIFRAFNNNGGIGSRFESFKQLAASNFERNKDGGLQIRDDAGELVIYKDPDAPTGTDSERVATPADFMKMLSSGAIAKSRFQFNQLEMLQLTLEAYNKSDGPLLPGNNGYNSVKSLDEMSQGELAKLAFKQV